MTLKIKPSALPNLPGGHGGHADEFMAPATVPYWPLGLPVGTQSVIIEQDDSIRSYPPLS